MSVGKEPRIARLLGILLMLRAKEWVPASDLSKRFVVSVRTIYRDVEFMQAHGIPIQGSSGPDRGYRLEKESPIDPLQFDSDDAMTLYLQGATGAGMPDSLTKRAEAILGALSPDHRSEACRVFALVKQRVYFDTTEWYWRDQSSGVIPQVREGVLSERMLRIRHYPRGSAEDVTVVLCPYGLVWKAGEWYVVGQAEKRRSVERIRLARIIACEVENRSFEYPPEFDVRRWWAGELERFGKGSIKVRLRGANSIRGELLSLQTKETSVVEFDERGVRLTLFVDRWEWLVPLVLSYGTSICVDEPLELRCAVAEELERALAQYRGIYHEPKNVGVNDDSRRRATRGRPQD